MISLIAIGTAVLMFLYGLYVLVRGRVGAGVDGADLIGWSARKIGIIYVLAPCVALFNLFVFYAFLMINGVSEESLDNDYEVYYFLVILLTLSVFLYAIVTLSKRIYLKNIGDNDKS